MNCPKCNSENIEQISVTYTLPSFNVYACKDCKEQFEICNNETIPHIDLTKSVELPKKETRKFINFIINYGKIEDVVEYNDEYYALYKFLIDKIFYKNKEGEFVHIDIKYEDIRACFKLYQIWSGISN